MPPCAAIKAGFFLFTLVRARGPTVLHEPDLVRMRTYKERSPHYKVREITLEAEPERSCPNGFEPSGGNCLQVESAPPAMQCPPGWTYSDDRTECIGYSALTPEHTCDEGEPEYDKCIMQRTVPKILSCPPEFSLDKSLNECVRELEHLPLSLCGPGERQSLSGLCIKIHTEMPYTRCPAAYELINGLCVQNIEVEPIGTCPQGYYRNGDKCMKRIFVEPSRKCPVGAVLSGGDCLIERHTAPNFVCVAGTMMDGNHCVIETVATPRPTCNSGLHPNPITGMCEGDDVQAPIPECSKGTTYNPLTNQCGSANKLKQPNLACPPDYHFVGKTACVKHFANPPTKVCPAGFDFSGKDECVHKDISLPEARCPEGMFHHGTLCVSVDTVPFLLTCEDGMILEDKQCTSIAVAEPVYKCPGDNYALTSANKCLSRMVDPPSLVCPRDTDQRYDAERGLVCLQEIQREATYACTINQQLKNNRCIEELKASPSATCPTGYFEDLHSGRCFMSEASSQRAFCPVGYRLIGDRCLKREQSSLVPICPPGWDLKENICVREVIVPRIDICPFGFDLIDGTCLAKKLQYDFDEEEVSQEDMKVRPGGPDEESNLPLNPGIPTAPEEENVEIKINRPVVQKGLVVRNEPITLSGPASEVAKKQALIAANAGNLSNIDNLEIEYVPQLTTDSNILYTTRPTPSLRPSSITPL